MKLPILVGFALSLLFLASPVPGQQPVPKGKPDTLTTTNHLFRGVGSMRVEVVAQPDERDLDAIGCRQAAEALLASRNLLGTDSAPGKILIELARQADPGRRDASLFYLSVRFTRLAGVVPRSPDPAVLADARIWERYTGGSADAGKLRDVLHERAMKFVNELLDVHATATTGFPGPFLPDETRHGVSPSDSVRGLRAIQVKVDLDPISNVWIAPGRLRRLVESELKNAGIEVVAESTTVLTVSIHAPADSPRSAVESFLEPTRFVRLLRTDLYQLAQFIPPPSGSASSPAMLASTWQDWKLARVTDLLRTEDEKMITRFVGNFVKAVRVQSRPRP